MNQILFIHGNVITGNGILKNHSVLTKDGKITQVGSIEPDSLPSETQVVDCRGNYLSPGFIDIHTHGGGGFDFMDGTKEDIIGAARAHLLHGTTTIVPTTLTCSDSDLYLFFDNYKQVKTQKTNMPNLAGIHLEGPYFSPVQAGAQDMKLMRTPDPEHYLPILDYAKDDIIRWSTAPELPGALALGDELCRHNILASAGHTNATYQELSEAAEHGYTHLTHLYSGMSTITRRQGHRVLGAVEAAYLIDKLTVEIIADGIHLPPELLRLILKCKNHDQICLVTDSMRGAGMPDGPSVLGSKKNGLKVMIENGIANMADHSGFAGSVATTDRLIRVMTKQAGLPLWEAVRMASYIPARIIGLSETKGLIAPGMDADLLVFDEDITVKEIYVMGTRINPCL